MKIRLKNLPLQTIISGILSLTACNYANNKSVIETSAIGQTNAIWTESIYFRGYNPTTKVLLDNKYIRNYAIKLKENNIRYAFIFAGPIGKDGHLPSFAFSDTAKRSILKFKQYNPDLIVLPWIGGIQNKTVFLNDSAWVKNAIADTKKMVSTLKVTGVHVDFEYIVPGELVIDSAVTARGADDMADYPANVNSFHKLLRDSLPNAFISAVVTSTAPETNHWKRKTSLTELNGLLPSIDQLIFLFYDTAINDTAQFRNASESMMKDIHQLRQQRDIQYLLAIGTFDNPSQLQIYRNMDIENIPNTLENIKKAASKFNERRKPVDGICIFCDWETSSIEWQEIKQHWTGL